MKKANALKLWPVLCAVLVLGACQKEVSKPNERSTVSTSIQSTGAVVDDPAKLSKIPLIISGKLSTQNIPSLIDMPAPSKGKPKPTPGTTDATPPSVNITSPANGSTVSGTVSVQVSASDNVGVSSVSLSVDGAVIATLTAAPYNFSWNATDGSHTLTATATDAVSNSSSSSVGVTTSTPVTTLPPPPTSFPASYELKMPPVGHQGSEGSCVAWSTCYARGCEQFYRTGASSYAETSNIYSAEFLYDLTKSTADCSSGTAFSKTLDFLVSNGVCTWASMPYDPNNGCNVVPTSAQNAEALNYRIANYSKIIETDRDAMKNMIVNNHALMINVTIDGNFRNAYPGYIWNSYSGFSGNHSITICGYDDSKNAWKVINSWGTSWGDAGYSWIDYDFFPTVSSYYVYVIN